MIRPRPSGVPKTLKEMAQAIYEATLTPYVIAYQRRTGRLPGWKTCSHPVRDQCDAVARLVTNAPWQPYQFQQQGR